MELKFYIGSTEIAEPIGFDNFISKIERSSEHGIGAENSLDSLEFVGEAYSIIKNAYLTNIDNQLLLKVLFNCEDKAPVAVTREVVKILTSTVYVTVIILNDVTDLKVGDKLIKVGENIMTDCVITYIYNNTVTVSKDIPGPVYTNVTEFTFEITENDSFDEIYRGIIDLSTYDETNADYCSCKCKIGEIGARTTFNNRSETQVDLSSLKTLDGAVLLAYENLNKTITVPAKDIVCTNNGKTSAMSIIAGYKEFDVTADTQYALIIGFDNQEYSELGALNTSPDIKWIGDIDSLTPTFYDCKYDISNIKISYDLNFGISISSDSVRYEAKLVLVSEVNGVKSIIRETTHTNYNQQDKNISDSFSADIAFSKETKLYLYVNIQGRETVKTQNSDISISFAENNTNFINISSLTNIASTSSKISLIHESISRISEIISGLKVKSDWYGRTDSEINPVQTIGGGALKAITSGLKLRQAALTNGSEPYLFLSFKEIYQAMKAIDNIGWGFSHENGVLCVRVENWKWFYKNDLIMSFTDVYEVNRTVDTKNIYSRLKIGYSKYSDIQELNAIDTFHTERNYTNGLKAIDNQLEQLCKFIADPYAIEFTRRKALDKTTEDWTYDENIFVFALEANSQELQEKNIQVSVQVDGAYINLIFLPDVEIGKLIKYNGESYEIDTIDYSTGKINTLPSIITMLPIGVYIFTVDEDTNITYDVETGVTDSENTIISPETMLNARISPERNALRWVDSLFNFASFVNVIDFNSGKGNIDAKFSVVNKQGHSYLDTTSGVVSEKDGLSRSPGKLKAEILSFEYPLTAYDYNLIKSNPYGKFSVNGEMCYLKSMEYNFSDGLAKFKMIPTYD